MKEKSVALTIAVDFIGAVRAIWLSIAQTRSWYTLTGAACSFVNIAS